MANQRSSDGCKSDGRDDGGDAYDTAELGYSTGRTRRPDSMTRDANTHVGNINDNNPHESGYNMVGGEDASNSCQDQSSCQVKEELDMARKPPKNATKAIKKLTKHGRYTSDITLEEMEKYYHLPAYEAARRMGIGLTILKRLCRKFGVQRWPYQRRRFSDMEEDELLKSYNRLQKTEKKEGDPTVASKPVEDSTPGKNEIDQSMVGIIMHAIQAMYPPKQDHDYQDLVEGLGGCISKLVEILQEINKRLQAIRQQPNLPQQTQESNQYHPGSSQENQVDLMRRLQGLTSFAPPVAPSPVFGHQYPLLQGNSVFSSQYGQINAIQSGFSPYLPAPPGANPVEIPGSLPLPPNQMPAPRLSDSQMWDILKLLQSTPSPGNDRQNMTNQQR